MAEGTKVPVSGQTSEAPDLSELGWRQLRPGSSGGGLEEEGVSRLVLVNIRTGKVLGAVSTGPAESSPLAPVLRGEDRSAIPGTYFVGGIELSDDIWTAGALPLLFYLGIREARRQGRSLVVADLDQASASFPQVAEILRALSFEEVDTASAGASETGRRVWAADVQRSALSAFESMPMTLRDWVAEKLLTDELEGTIRDRAAEFYKTTFFKRVFDGTLTRGQYIESVANNHQFVRWTTRLLGRLVGMTADQRLRRHFVNHLQGEVDHDTLLENDLRYLGADPEYVRTKMVPCREIQQFMVVQESVIGFHQDPVVAMATPFAIESATAFMDARFIEALRTCISSWGYSTPGRGCTFLSSHIRTDGGEDGHWEATKRMLRSYMRDEITLQKALNVANLVMDGVIRAYDAYGRRPSIEHLRSRSS